MVAFEEVKEENTGCLVRDGGSEALTSDHVPTCCLIFKFFVHLELILNFGSQFFV